MPVPTHEPGERFASTLGEGRIVKLHCPTVIYQFLIGFFEPEQVEQMQGELVARTEIREALRIIPP